MAEYKGTAVDFNKIKTLEKKRERDREDFLKNKQDIQKRNTISDDVVSISSKFSSTIDRVEEQLKKDTVGLVTLEDFTKKKDTIQQLAQEELLLAAEAEKSKNRE